MKNTMVVFGIAAAMMSGAAFAAQDGFYIGATLGRSSVGSPTPNLILTKSTDTVGGVLAGYQFNKNWGAEIFYSGAGKYTGVNAAGTVTGSGKSDVWGLDAVGTLPLSDSFSLYGKLGVARVKSSVSTVPASTLAGASRTAATYGLGGTYSFNQSFSIRLGWDHYGASTTGGSGVIGAKDNYNSNVYSLAAVFGF